MDSKGKKDESLALHASDAEPNGGSCESEPRYQQLVEMMNEGLARADSGYVFSYVNRRFADMLGYTPKEMIGHSLLDFVHPDDRELMQEQISQRKKGEAARYELAWRSKDGRKVHTLVSPRPVFDDEGSFAGSVAVLTDITDRKMTEKALQESEEKFRDLTERTSDWVWEVDQHGVYTYASPRVRDLLGYEPEEVVGKTPFDFMPEDTAREIGRIFFQIAEKHAEIKLLENTLVRRDGSLVVVETSGVPIVDKTGALQGYRGIDRDITDRKLAEQALHERMELEALIMQISTQFINLPADKIDDGINSALRTIGEFTGVDRSYVFRFYDDGTRMENTHEWCAEGVEPQIQRLKGLKVDSLPWFAERIRRLETVYVPLVSDLPDEAAAEKKEWRLAGIQSLICVPMVYQGSLIGFVGFDAIRLTKWWPDDNIALLKMVANILVNALERKNAEEALKESEERYRSLVELSPDMVTMTTDGKIAYANPAGAKLVGAEKPEDLVGRSPLDLIHPSYRDAVKERMRLMIEEGKTVPTIEEQFLRMDGTYIDVEVAAMPVVYKGKPSILAVMRDITERKRAEEALRQERDRARTYLDVAGAIMLVIGADGMVTMINRKGCEILGYREDEIIGKNWFESFVPETVREPVRKAFARLIAGEVAPVEYYENPVLTSNGEERLIAWHNAVLRDEQGKIQSSISSGEDITERKRAEEALRRSEANFRAIFDYMPAVIFGYDSDGVIVQANEECERLFGFSRQELIGHSLYETISAPKDHARRREVIARVFAGETVEGLEWQDRRSDGSTIYVLSNTTPVYNTAGQITMGVSLSIDITERKLAEQRRRELETHKRDFYRRTIQAATEGKLLISEKVDIERIAGPAIGTWGIGRGEDLGAIRQAVTELAEKAGMDSDRVYDFVLTVGESTTNAYKHAGGGTASLHNIPDGFLFMVSDKGHGIEALTLPEVALVRGYSTAGSLGMGYKAILAIADKVYLATGPTGTTVAIAMRLHPAPKPVEAALLPDTWTS